MPRRDVPAILSGEPAHVQEGEDYGREGGSLPSSSRLFVSSAPFTLFDYFKIPYDEDAWCVVGPAESDARLAFMAPQALGV